MDKLYEARYNHSLICFLSMNTKKSSSDINQWIKCYPRGIWKEIDKNPKTIHQKIKEDEGNDVSNLCSSDIKLRNIETGTIAFGKIAVETQVETGKDALKSMEDQTADEFDFKKSKQMFELSSSPAILFELPGLIRQAQKSEFADVLWNTGDRAVYRKHYSILPYVIDGCSLIQRLLWTKGTSFGEICQLYVDYIKHRYDHAVILFYCYTPGPSTKDILTHATVKRSSRC
ncbi:unnamed protein product [Mytilus coruscus]|uniref:Uncharacterized protein n=1 Tax=Mytilus coruscus TaxID=42192 RepID=A0A6J8AJM0_MYTCO|nr:unnamed protein product [Mytilus coruscus]